MNTISLQEALRAQKALREAAGLAPEMFAIEAFVGMISDEIETLRSQGKSDEEIAGLVSAHSNVAISAAEITENYAPPEERHQRHG